MKIERFEVPGLAQFSYLVSSQGRAAVIDAARDVDRYLDYAKAHNLTITHVFETHIHADFAAGSVELAAITGAELALSGYDEHEHYRYAMPHRRLRDGDAVDLGAVRLAPLHTPGHTPEHISLVLYDNTQTVTEPMAMFSGDFLFVGSLGRPDLLGDAAKVALAGELYRSLHRRIAALPDAVAVYPGHGAGSLCGAGIGRQVTSTLGFERRTGHLFRLEEDAFVEEILATVPDMPAYYPRMKALNAAGSPVLGVLPGARAIPLSEASGLALQDDVQVLDLRSVEAFAAGHIAGAVHLGAGPNLPLWAGWLLNPGKRVLLVHEHGDDEPSRRMLVRVGLDRIAGSVAGGMRAWTAHGLPVVAMPQWSAQETSQLLGTALLLDVRAAREWDADHIDGAQHLPLGEFTAQTLAMLPRQQRIVTVCGSGYRASAAASLLARAGFPDVGSMTGGMQAWQSVVESRSSAQPPGLAPVES